MTDREQHFESCPDCGAPLREIHTHIPGSVVREYRCGVRWLDVDDERKRAALSGSPMPCNYVRELRATIRQMLCDELTCEESAHPCLAWQHGSGRQMAEKVGVSI